ncbi:MAG: type II toxin-antitoxin system RelE/ParE family toxin [Abitibacteriaceae bacterium]|nr:type II toxin-antitoxin system RelE/ParE family toxin [Abditibacteriaceae bacterium]
MAQPATGSQPDLIEFAPLAQSDLAAIYTYTAQQWGQAQADKYMKFLEEILLDLVSDPTQAALLTNPRGVTSHTAKRQGARHGHRMFFEQTEMGIYVLRILHTARNWREALPESIKRLNIKHQAARK